MYSIIENRLTRHGEEARKQLLEENLSSPSGLFPLSDVLSAQQIQDALEKLGISFRDRIFTPWITLWTFLTQVLSADSSCRSAVSRLISWLSVQGMTSCSSATGAYVQARSRLPEELFRHLAMQVGSALHAKTADQADWSFHGRSVKMADGTSLTLPDTRENQSEYRQPKTRRKYAAPGFPMLRVLTLISSSTGGLLNLKIAPCAGKGTGEPSLLRQILEDPSSSLHRGDILLMDRLFCSYFILATCQLKGVDCVVRIHSTMKREKFEFVKQIARGDRLVRLLRPANRVTARQNQLNSLPGGILLREITHRIHRKGFRPKTILLLTSLVDEDTYSKTEIADLYWSRWNCELDLRAMKSVMQMNELSCKTPEMVRKEIWAYMLGYNLVRTAMAQSAITSELKVTPRQLSFKGALQLINAYRPYFLAVERKSSNWAHHYRAMLKAIGQQKLVRRPGRIEPRAIKRKPSSYCALRVTRDAAKFRYWKKGRDSLRRKANLEKTA